MAEEGVRRVSPGVWAMCAGKMSSGAVREAEGVEFERGYWGRLSGAE